MRDPAAQATLASRSIQPLDYDDAPAFAYLASSPTVINAEVDDVPLSADEEAEERVEEKGLIESENPANESGNTRKRSRRRGPRKKWKWHHAVTAEPKTIFVALCISQASAGIAMLTVLFLRSKPLETSHNRILALSLALFALASAFELSTVAEAIVQHNILQISLLIPLQIMMTIYAATLAAQFGQSSPNHRDHIRLYTTGLLATIIVVTAGMVWSAWRLREDLGWRMFYLLGGDRNIRKLFDRYRSFLCLLKFDFFFFVGFQIVIISIKGDLFRRSALRDPDFFLLPAIAVALVLGGLSARYEWYGVMNVFLGAQLAEFIYFAVRLSGILRDVSLPLDTFARNTFIVFGVASLLLSLLTLVVARLIMRNFGHGLREALPPYWSRQESEPQEGDERMAID